mmetsp:Transcript_31669/g.72632  ORF Transcript_31669/g.72632 Transcript_31669/m.72632 type:complete len:244 (-) Transcript_31669:2413-3144(-)
MHVHIIIVKVRISHLILVQKLPPHRMRDGGALLHHVLHAPRDPQPPPSPGLPLCIRTPHDPLGLDVQGRPSHGRPRQPHGHPVGCVPGKHAVAGEGGLSHVLVQGVGVDGPPGGFAAGAFGEGGGFGSGHHLEGQFAADFPNVFFQVAHSSFAAVPADQRLQGGAFDGEVRGDSGGGEVFRQGGDGVRVGVGVGVSVGIGIRGSIGVSFCRICFFFFQQTAFEHGFGNEISLGNLQLFWNIVS